MIKTAKIISTDSAEDEVGMNNTVTVYFEEDDEEEVYKIVTTVRGNSLKNLISMSRRSARHCLDTGGRPRGSAGQR